MGKITVKQKRHLTSSLSPVGFPYLLTNNSWVRSKASYNNRAHGDADDESSSSEEVQTIKRRKKDPEKN